MVWLESFSQFLDNFKLLLCPMFNFNWFHLNAFFNRWLLWNTFNSKSTECIANEKKTNCWTMRCQVGRKYLFNFCSCYAIVRQISMTRTRKPFVMRERHTHKTHKNDMRGAFLVVASQIISLFCRSSHECNYSRTSDRVAPPSKQFYYKFHFNFSLDRCIVAWTNGHGLIRNYLCIFHSLGNFNFNEMKS